MLENYNRYKILKVFLDSPTESFGLREIARLSGISPPSVMNYLKQFEQKNLIRKEEKKGIPAYTSIRDSQNFIMYKKLSILYELNKSGLINHLWDAFAPDAIILFGSFARGESTESSDIDLFVLGKEIPVKIAHYEDLLGKKVHLLFNESVHKVPKELRNNIINGIVLKGYIKAF